MNSRDASVNNGLSLKSLAADLLNVCLDKSVELRCSDWEAAQLTPDQVLVRSVALRRNQQFTSMFQNLLEILTSFNPSWSHPR